MAVHPDHQHRGVGTMLMEWGIRHIDGRNLESFIEATTAGRRLYEKFRYRVLICNVIDTFFKDATDTWRALSSQLGDPRHWLM